MTLPALPTAACTAGPGTLVVGLVVAVGGSGSRAAHEAVDLAFWWHSGGWRPPWWVGWWLVCPAVGQFIWQLVRQLVDSDTPCSEFALLGV